MIQTPGTHVPTISNRSSKHLFPLCKMKPAVKSMSNAALAEYSCAEARKELSRRQKKGGGSVPETASAKKPSI